MNVRAMIGGTLRLVLAGPPLALGAIFTGVARFVDETCLRIEGKPAPVPVRVAPKRSRCEAIDYQRGARVLYACDFDTAAIAELLTCDEADVARWVCAS